MQAAMQRQPSGNLQPDAFLPNPVQRSTVNIAENPGRAKTAAKHIPEHINMDSFPQEKAISIFLSPQEIFPDIKTHPAAFENLAAYSIPSIFDLFGNLIFSHIYPYLNKLDILKHAII